jgi:hypothetical protein
MSNTAAKILRNWWVGTNLSQLTAGLCQGVLQGAREEGGCRLPIPAHRVAPESYRLQCFGSGLDPDSNRSVDPYSDPGGQK